MAPDTTPSLGEFLRQERERRGITIEQVASATKIGVRLLHSLESDQYAELPAKPFIRGFVTSYCRFIGIDPKEALTRFGDFIEGHAHDRPNREGGHSGYAFEKTGADRSRVYLGAFMGGFVVLGGIAYVFLKPSLHHSHGSHLDKLKAAHGGPAPALVASSPEPVASIAAAAPSPSSLPSLGAATAASPSPSYVAAVTSAASPAPVVPSPKPSLASESESESPEPSPAATSETSAADPLNSGLDLKTAEIRHKAVIKAFASVWVRYRVDEKPVMRFILRKDKVLVLRAKGMIRFQTSDPKSVKYAYNGRSYRPLNGDSNFVPRQNDATLILPHELAETSGEPFPGEKSLLGRVVPQPKVPAPLSTPSP